MGSATEWRWTRWGKRVLLIALLATCAACNCRGIGLTPETKFRCLSDGGCAAGSFCDGRYCVACANGLCEAPPAEVECANGADDDRDGLADCLDPDCNGRFCDDHDACTTGEVCLAGTGACGSGQQNACNTAPTSCFLIPGTCNPADAGCSYEQLDAGSACGPSLVCGRAGECLPAEGINPVTTCANGVDEDDDGLPDCLDPDCSQQSCDDLNACTTGEICADAGSCEPEQTKTCDSPPTTCFLGPGACNPADAGCSYTQLDVGSPCDAGLYCGRSGGCLAPEGLPLPVRCANGEDDDDNGLTDCQDPGCQGKLCSDGNHCTTGERCNAGTCSGGSAVVCGSCFGNATCNPDSGCPTSSVNVWAPCDGGVCGVTGSCRPCFSGFCLADAPAPMTLLTGASGTSSTDVWAVGPGLILHFNGSAWSVSHSGRGDKCHWSTDGGSECYEAVWAVSATDVWAVGRWQLVSHWNGSSWDVPSMTDTGLWLYGVWGASTSQVWAGGDNIMLGWNGSSWLCDTTFGDAGSSNKANRMWGSGPTDIWTVGPLDWSGVRTSHFDGGVWAEVPTGQLAGMDGWDIHGTAASNIWVVGSPGGGNPGSGAMRFNGTAWSTLWNDPDGGALRAVWVRSATDVWAAGDRGLVLHNTTGTAGGWAVVDVGTSQDLADIWGTASDLWIVGNQSTLLRYRQ